MATVTNEPRDQVPGQEVVYNGSERRSGAERRREVSADRVTTAAITSGSSLELLGGAAAVVLAIIGLTGFMPGTMTAIATIVIGGALLVHGAAVAARWKEAQQVAIERNERFELAGGLGSEVLGGATAVVLGILALANIVPLTLLAVAAIVLGGSIMFGAPAQPDIARLAPDRDQRFGNMTYRAVETSTGAMELAGIGAVVLGILALLRIGPPLTLVMVAMLAVGAAVLLGGSALTARFARRLQHTS